jgi:hypothetical protein
MKGKFHQSGLSEKIRNERDQRWIGSIQGENHSAVLLWHGGQSSRHWQCTVLSPSLPKENCPAIQFNPASVLLSHQDAICKMQTNDQNG